MQATHRHIYSMGTRLDMVFTEMDPERCDYLTGLIRAELDRIEQKLSIHTAASELSLINTSAFAGAVQLDEELSGIFAEIKILHTETGGYFDPTMKPVFNRLVLEGNELTEDINSIVGLDKVVIEEERIRFRNKGVIIDPGGFGKGYAVRRILQILKSEGIDRALINFGESLIYGLGSHPYGDCWKVSVPTAEISGPVHFKLINESLSTSGNSLNNQKKFANSGHIVNPVTRQISAELGLVSVKSKDPVRAEAFSTAFFCAGPQESEQILKGKPDLEVRWLYPDN